MSLINKVFEKIMKYSFFKEADFLLVNNKRIKSTPEHGVKIIAENLFFENLEVNILFYKNYVKNFLINKYLVDYIFTEKDIDFVWSCFTKEKVIFALKKKNEQKTLFIAYALESSDKNIFFENFEKGSLLEKITRVKKSRFSYYNSLEKLLESKCIFQMKNDKDGFPIFETRSSEEYVMEFKRKYPERKGF